MAVEGTQGAGGPRVSRRKPGLGPAERGQTLHDYTIGISLFVLTVSAVLAALFGFLGPLSVGVGSEEVAQSERISETMVQNLSSERQPNELRADGLESTLDQSVDRLRARWGIERSTSLNVTLTTLNGSRILERGGTKLTVGSQYEGSATGTTARIVTLDDGTCDPACRLVVRTW